MADTETFDSVIPALSDLYVACQTACEQIKRSKVRFKVRYRYCKLVEHLMCMLHCHCCPCHMKDKEHAKRDEKNCGHCCSCWSIAVLHRIEGLGGDAESTLDHVTITDDVKPALERIRDVLQLVIRAAILVETAAKSSMDCPSAKIAAEIQCAATCHVESVDAYLRQIKDFGDSYILTLV